MKKWLVLLSIISLQIASAQNVGIGNANPTLAGLVADTKVGAVNAAFGSNTSGVTIESNYPGIGFNTYYNNGRKAIANGYGGLISVDPVNGGMGFYVTNASFNAGNAVTMNNAISIKSDGNVGIGSSAPGFPLNFPNTLGDKISLYGNTGSHYGFGIQNSLLQIHSGGSGDDIAFGYGSSSSFTETMRIKGNGNVGIGTNPASEKLEITGNVKALAFKYSTPKTYYLSLPPASFQAMQSNEFVETSRTSGLMFNVPAPTYGMIAPVLLPHGAVITNLTAYYYDVNAENDMVVYLNRDQHGTFSGGSILATTTSAGITGHGSTTTSLIVSSTIDNMNYKYSVQVNSLPGSWQSGLQITSVVIAYTLSEAY